MRSYNGGRAWRVRESGEVEVERKVITSGGAPTTARLFLLEYGEAAHQAAKRFSIPVPWIVGMAAIEAIRLKAKPRGGEWGKGRVNQFMERALPGRGWRLLKAAGVEVRGRVNALRMDPVSLRYESEFVSPEDTPGRVSAGLMQTLLSTARDMADRYPDTAPRAALSGARRKVELGDLLIPELSILWGAAYMRHLIDREAERATIPRLLEDGRAAGGMDFVLMTGAYNAGGIIAQDPNGPKANPFGLLTYGEARTDLGVRYHNDCWLPGARELVEDWAWRLPPHE